MERYLYLGLDPARFPVEEATLVHHPVIAIQPLPYENPKVQQLLCHMERATHVLLTSRSAVQLFFQHARQAQKTWEEKRFVSVGRATAESIQQCGGPRPLLPQSECAEGVIDLLAALDLSGSLVLYPHSAIARPLLRNFLNERKIPHFAAALYETVPLWQSPLDLEQFSRIVFTSPSTVEGFLQIYPNLPNSNKIYAIGPVTRRYLERLIVKNGKSC